VSKFVTRRFYGPTQRFLNQTWATGPPLRHCSVPAGWAWSLPLIVLNVTVHVLGLGLINERVVRFLRGAMERRHFTAVFAVVMGATALFATALHARSQ
jgi:hypothetical protein